MLNPFTHKSIQNPLLWWYSYCTTVPLVLEEFITENLGLDYFSILDLNNSFKYSK